MKIGQYCQRQHCRHVELEQFWQAFASCGFVSDSWAFLYLFASVCTYVSSFLARLFRIFVSHCGDYWQQAELLTVGACRMMMMMMVIVMFRFVWEDLIIFCSWQEIGRKNYVTSLYETNLHKYRVDTTLIKKSCFCANDTWFFMSPIFHSLRQHTCHMSVSEGCIIIMLQSPEIEFSHFDRIPHRDRRKDRQTEGHFATAYITLCTVHRTVWITWLCILIRSIFAHCLITNKHCVSCWSCCQLHVVGLLVVVWSVKSAS